MVKRTDFTGQKFGYLTVRALEPKVKGVRTRKWICGCSACGSTVNLPALIVREKSQASCGCKPALTVRAFELAKGMRADRLRLVKSLPNIPDAPDVCFFLEPSGRSVVRADAESAIEAKEVIPLADGLFHDTAQTWVPA